MNEKRKCSKSKGCKKTKCIHHEEHEKTPFCDGICDTHPEAECIK
jgi:hypothetical protein